MKTKISNLFFTGLFIFGAVLSGCSKNESIKELNENPQLLSAKTGSGDLNATQGEILNRDLVIGYARDNGVDITAQFRDFTFNFQGSAPAGQAHVWNDLLAQTGTWSFSEGTDVFTLKYPTGIFQQLVFLNRTWRIGESSSAVLRLYSEDGDEVQFLQK